MNYDYRNLTEKHFILLDQETNLYRRNTLVEESRHFQVLDKIFAMVEPKKPVAAEKKLANREYQRRYMHARRHCKLTFGMEGYEEAFKKCMAEAPEKLR